MMLVYACISLSMYELNPPKPEPQTPALPAPPRPLVVDLDGTLVSTDTLIELSLEVTGRQPAALPEVLASLTSGRVRFKQVLAKNAALDVSILPYRDVVLELIREARANGRPTVLATASHESTAQAVAEHLGLFDAVLATSVGLNVKGDAKLEAIRTLLTERGWGERFDYVGDSRADLPVWSGAQTAYLVDVKPEVADQVVARQRVIELVPSSGGRLWLELMHAARPYQWSKNLLLLVPLVASQQAWTFYACFSLLVAIVAFSLCASAVYLTNDLLDLRADRLHPTKRSRPIAAGRLSPRHAILGAGALMVGSFFLSMIALPHLFTQVLAVYFVLTLAYSLYIKGKVMLDVVWLASLYTLRIIAGGIAVAITPSEWLLGFTLFTFLSLAYAKRFCELRLLLANSGKQRTAGRGYHTDDLQIVQTMGVGSGYLSVLIFAMYINSDTVRTVYSEPHVLWLACPLILYWMSRMWMLAQRGLMRGDPLLFALTDRISYLCLGLLVLVMYLAHF